MKIRAVDVNGSRIGYPSVLPDFLNRIPAEQKFGRVTADSAYDTRKCHHGHCRTERTQCYLISQERESMEGNHSDSSERDPAG